MDFVLGELPVLTDEWELDELVSVESLLCDEVLFTSKEELSELSVTELVLNLSTVEWLLLASVEELELVTTNSVSGTVLMENSTYGVLPTGK